MKKFIGGVLVAALGAVIGVGIIKFFEKDAYYTIAQNPAYQMTTTPIEPGSKTVIQAPNFVDASSQATPAVVHIKSYIKSGKGNNPFGGLFGDGFEMPGGQASGSGVIISDDGYIATNNHVIDGADKVQVTLVDKREYNAKVIGTDPSTDLALLKIEGKQFPSLSFGNSDDLDIGEWVLAVGNPFNLTSTVTAGIVSAKGRNLNLLDEAFAIESFIQTDAAVNPGNSGGALINTQGELIGINTAIASRTGSYAGYSFAVPSNVVKKVMTDLEEFGVVQRAIIGVRIQNINAEFADQNDLNILSGAFVAATIPGGAAEEYGIKPGDVIINVNGAPVKSASELQEEVATYRPGDKVKVTVLRNKQQKVLDVVLKNKNGTTKLVHKEAKEIEDKEDVAYLGGELSPISERDKRVYNITNGVKVSEVTGGLLAEAGIEEGYIITRVNKTTVDSPEDVQELLADANGKILIEGVDKYGDKMNYAFGF